MRLGIVLTSAGVAVFALTLAYFTFATASAGDIYAPVSAEVGRNALVGVGSAFTAMLLGLFVTLVAWAKEMGRRR